MKINQLIRDLEDVREQLGDVQVVVKESSGIYREKIDAGWDGGHVIGSDAEKVAIIFAYTILS